MNKRCSLCKKKKPLTDFTADLRKKDGLQSRCTRCRVQDNRERKQRYSVAGLCEWCGEQPKRENRKTCQRCEDRRRQREVTLKLEVFSYYGGASCNCCGEKLIEFLSVDHKENNGAEHRRELKNGSLYRWLKKNNYPKGYQVLCMNCNFSKGRFGYCPHER